jgi:hypothetical protein
MLVLFNKQTKYIEHTSLQKIEVWKLRKEYLSSNGLQFHQYQQNKSTSHLTQIFTLQNPQHVMLKPIHVGLQQS